MAAVPLESVRQGEAVMADTITFYTHPMSRGLTVHWLLEELGAPYEMKVLERVFAGVKL